MCLANLKEFLQQAVQRCAVLRWRRLDNRATEGVQADVIGAERGELDVTPTDVRIDNVLFRMSMRGDMVDEDFDMVYCLEQLRVAQARHPGDQRADLVKALVERACFAAQRTARRAHGRHFR